MHMNRADKVYTVENLSFSYGKNEVLNQISFSIPEGKITTLIGANGCGKSTLFQLLTRNLNPASGTILLGERPVNEMKLKELAREAAIVHQYHVTPPDLTVEKLVAYGRLPYQSAGGVLPAFFCKQDPEKKMSGRQFDQEKIDWALQVTNTEKIRKKAVSSLSGGQKQRVWIAMALAQDTKLLLLDEPTTYLDVRYQIQILRLIRELNEKYGMTIVMVLHEINQALAYSDEILAMKDGKIVAQGAPEKVINEELLSKVYGVELPVYTLEEKKFVLAV